MQGGRTYNGAVPNPPDPRPARNRARRAETVGLLIVVAIVLLLVVLRWGPHIAWSAR